MAVHAEASAALYRATSAKGTRRLKATVLRAYSDQKQKTVHDQRIVELLPMIPRIANRVVAYLKPPLTFDDLIAAGTVGLVKAAKDYDASYHAEFKTYAFIRIKGAILDELKKWSFLSPEMARQVSAANQAATTFRLRTGSQPSDEQLASELGVTAEKLSEILESNRSRMFLSIDSSNGQSCSLLHSLLCDNETTPHENIEQAELIEQLTEAIGQLPKKKRQTIILYYQQHLTMKQIAEVLKITESRVSQLHASALFSLSLRLKEWKDGGQ
jgi:RNA polymerase sigma factor for flagellar operon FliA